MREKLLMKNLLINLYKQVVSHKYSLGVVYFISFLFLGYILILCRLTDSSISGFMREPATIFHASPFIGFVSNTGILVWTFAAVLCFFSAAMIANKKNLNRMFYFYLFSALITTILLLDDFFMLHELIFPVYFHIPEKLVYLSYMLLILIYLFTQRKIILQTDYLILFFAFLFFGLSTIMDMVRIDVPVSRSLFEDGFKLVGIVSWAMYFWIVCSKSFKFVNHFALK